MKNKFKIGTIVFAKMFPEKKLIVSRYANKLYHCFREESPKRKEWLYFEKELTIIKIHKNGNNQHDIRSSERSTED